MLTAIMMPSYLLGLIFLTIFFYKLKNSFEFATGSNKSIVNFLLFKYLYISITFEFLTSGQFSLKVTPIINILLIFLFLNFLNELKNFLRHKKAFCH